jgi:hypothetical protein
VLRHLGLQDYRICLANRTSPMLQDILANASKTMDWRSI